ncbi:MAG TPA: phosphate ABC transporter substrate-binding protein PstS, partial [Pyrinomonadaceae bacterium]|nr:phosphate ABC transporter substrate-binding protein PstS [Pyrinomonadaceae bacterium]
MIRKRRLMSQWSALAAVFVLAFASFGCGGGASPVKPGGAARGGDSSGGGAVRLQGTGATFPAPLYQKWLSEYGKINGASRIDYQSTGSGTGVKQIQEGTVDFGASDQPMSDEELGKATGGEIVHIPTVLGAVVVTYNLPDVKEELRFSGDVLADIFSGKIKRWDDARIKADNPTATLPAADITVVARADGSGTSAVFTEYLAKVSA